MNEKYKVCVRIDSSYNIIEVNSDAFVDDIKKWQVIDEGVGDKYYHAQGNYFVEPIYYMDNFCFNYKLVNGKPRLKTDEEKQEEINNRPIEVSQIDKIEAQVAYTAMITDTLLKE